MNTFKFKNGIAVKDIISDCSGIITGRVDYLTGCIQYLVQPKMKKTDNTPPESFWIDEDRLEVVKSKKSSIKKKTNGFDKAAPKK